MKFHLLAIFSSLLLGAALSFIQPGNFFVGWLLFSFLFLLSFYAIRSTHADTYTGTHVDTYTGTHVDTQPAIRNPYLLSPITRLILLAFLLRLALGVTLTLALPEGGNPNPQHEAGYIFLDSYRRDAQAWELAQSDAPILSAFNKNFYSDQYGGLLAFSAVTYRYFSPDAHRPLLPVFFGALTAASASPSCGKPPRVNGTNASPSPPRGSTRSTPNPSCSEARRCANLSSWLLSPWPCGDL